MERRVKRYRVDLDRLMQIYAANYVLFCQMFPTDLDVGEKLSLRAETATSARFSDQLALTCCEQTRYTSVFAIRQHYAQQLPGLHEPQMTVRLYHDAGLAEVCASQQISRLKPRYDYPNHQMYHQDEKQQVNLFLYDWLHYCLKHRVAVDAPAS